MQVEPQITFKGVEPGSVARERILERIARLERFHDRIISCHVVVEAPHQHGRKGQLYHVRLVIAVPQGEIVVNREPELNHAHEDITVAIRDAFDAAQRQLEDHVRRLGGVHVKEHAAKGHGRVARLFTDEGYGFIAAPDGREFFFRRDSVTGNDWEALVAGSEVRFSEMEGEAGPYAAAVSLARRPGEEA